MSMPSAPFDTTKSLFNGRSVIAFTPTGGSVVTFESIKLDHKLEQEFQHIVRPDSLGVQRRVRSVLTKHFESFVYQVDEAKRLLSDLFSSSLSGIVSGTVQIWEPDPSDTGGKVALKSESFACTLQRDGDLKFGDGDFTKAQIAIISNKTGAVTWTADASS